MAPERRASLSPMAIACLRLFTLRRPPDLSSPCLYSCITLLIFFFAFGPYLRWLLLLELLLEARERLDFFEAEDRDVPRCDDLLPLLLCDRDLARARLCDELDLPWLELDFLAVAIVV